jgi:proline iminopeptidase
MRGWPWLVLWVCVVVTGCAPSRTEVPPPGDDFVATDDGLRLWYEVRGEGEDVLVVPAGMLLRESLAPLAEHRRVVFYDPRNRGRSDRADLANVSLDWQISDLENLRLALGVERMSLLGWSGLGMEMAAYTIRHPERVHRLVQLSPVAPAAAVAREAGGDRRAERIDQAALADLFRKFDAGEFDGRDAEFCRSFAKLTLPSNFADPKLADRVTDVCDLENEWPSNLFPYFDALIRSFGDYDWRPALDTLRVPRLVIHGREDGIPLAGAEAWVRGHDQARLLVVDQAGHFAFIEQPEVVFAAVNRFLDGEWPEGAVPVQ